MELLHTSTSCAILVSATVVFLFTWANVSERFVGLAPINTDESHPIKWAARFPPSPDTSEQSPARALIESIKEATRLASNSGTSSDSSDGNETRASEEREAWNLQNPCLSRLELIPMYDRRKYARNLPPNPVWDELLTEYSKLHRTCTQKVGNLTDYFLTGNVSTEGCQFAIADVAPGTGLGNKVFVLVSSLLYAILTQRVLLIPSSTLVPDYTCEPFLGSSWKLDSEAFPVPHIYERSKFNGSPWTYDREFFRRIDEEMKTVDQSTRESFESGYIIPATPLDHAVGVITHEWQPSNRFYCSAEQSFYSKATWLYLSGCIYTIPKLFATPSFRPTLEDLFPDKMASTRLLRSVFLPSDVVWGRVLRMNHAYLAGADRRVGIQVRYKDGPGQYTKMNDLVNERITDCTSRNGILPEVSSSSHGSDSIPAGVLKRENSSSSDPPLVKVFIASLFPGLLDHLSDTYVRYPTLSGEDVGLVQISMDLTQVLDSVDEDEQAFTEVLLLSFSDQLLVTPLSTFGGLAQAYGALTPWFIEMREDRQLQSCERGQTVDVCNQFTDKVYRCPYDPAVHERPFADIVPCVKDCLPIDHAGGIQLITTFCSS